MRKLLIVDDDKKLRRLMRLELSNNYQIIDSGEPEQGLALALEHRPDAILLDLRMPRSSGYELCQTFTSFSRTEMIRVIILTGEAGAQTKEHFKQLGAAAYFEKPVDFEALRDCLSQTANTLRPKPRTEAQVRLQVALKLRGMDRNNKKFEEVATTENVSLSGFLCNTAAELAQGSIVDVYLRSYGEDHVGKAKVVHADSKGGQFRSYGCGFTEKAGPWVLN